MLPENLKYLRQQRNLLKKDIASLLSVSESTYGKWELGKREPDHETLLKLANFFGVSTDYLLGADNNATLSTPNEKKGVKIPVLGKVQAGIPVEAIEDIIDYEEITEEMASQGDFFGLQIRGESMMPRFAEGDVVIVRKQPTVDSGDIAVVMVNGNDATIKKLVKQKNGISLVPLNPSFEPIFYTNKEIESLPVTVIGKAVELRAKL